MNLEYDEYEEYFKVIVVGNSNTGKTNIIQTFDKGTRPHHTAPTVGVDYCSKKVVVDQNQKVKLQIWDTAGQQQYRSITMGQVMTQISHYKNVLGAMILFDVTNRKSFNQLSRWIHDVRERSEENVVIMVVGNKIDQQMRDISKHQGEQFANRERVLYSETSIFEPYTIQKAFQRLGQQIHRTKRNNALNFSNDSITLNNTKNQANNCPC